MGSEKNGANLSKSQFISALWCSRRSFETDPIETPRRLGHSPTPQNGRGKTCQPFNSDTEVRIEFRDHTRFYYPDAMVVCQTNPDSDDFHNQPVVIIEVLSESTRRTDLGEKRDAYLTIPSLRLLLLVESEAPSVTVHRRAEQGGFAIARHAGIDAVIPLSEIGADLSLADLYERVEFTL